MPAKIVNRLTQFVSATDRKVARVATQALILIGSEASVLTPIDTSNLLNSQYRSLNKTASGIRASIGYTASYAPYVHDPKVKQNFRRATAEKLFLQKGGNRAKPFIDKLLARELKA